MHVPQSPSDWQPILGPLTPPAAECRALAAALARAPRPAIRVRPGVPRELLPWKLESVPWHDRGFFVEMQSESTIRPAEHVGFFAGCYYVQDAASLLAASVAEVKPHMLVCDLCAAPGGKATAIMEELEGGWLLANEAIQDRLPALVFNLARHGSVRYLVSWLDPSELAQSLSGQFDVVLVDAPCSGQSLVARHKQSVSAFRLSSIDFCAKREYRILHDAARLVRPGGRLVYATCTFAIQENEALIARFLDEHAGWKLDPCDKLAAWQSPLLNGAYRLWPHHEQTGAAFAARLRFEGDQPTPAQAARRARGPKPLEPSRWPRETQDWGYPSRPGFVWQDDWLLFASPEEPPASWWGCATRGPEFAVRKATTWFPAYALAMRRDGWWQPLQRWELDEQTAAVYLKGQVLPCSERGWAIVSWCHQPLGWAKGDGRQAKSHVPKGGRWIERSQADVV